MTMRSVINILGHMSFTAISGFAFGMTTYWYSLRKRKTWIFLPFFGYLFASTIHGLCNFLLSTTAWQLTFVIVGVLGVSLFQGFAYSSRVSPYRLFAFSEWQTALEYIEYGLRRDPENPILNLRKGIYKAYSGAWPEALRCFQDAKGSPFCLPAYGYMNSLSPGASSPRVKRNRSCEVTG